MSLMITNDSRTYSNSEKVPSPELPIRHEILFPELVKAGFKIEEKSEESPIETLLTLVKKVRNEGDKIYEFEHALRVCGHAHFIAYLHNDEVNGKADIENFSTYFPKIDVDVKKTSKYISPSEDVYKIGPKSKGNALIINNKYFYYDEPRYGSDRDFEYLQKLFTGLGYKVLLAEDLTIEKNDVSLGEFCQITRSQHI